MAATWRIRGFELDRRLGAGASSEVWRATVSSSGDAVALKRLTLSGGEQARRAVAEAAKLRVLDHPHLVRLHDLVLHRDAAVLVLDLADAGTLADLLVVRGRLTPGEAITAIAPIAAALAHVHAAGIVHGDVSPANILFTPGGVPLLADLGVSRLTGDDADAESTPAYVDPLVARGGVPTSHTDVFMLGAVALHALTGAPLWTASTGDAALAQACSAGLGHVEGRLAVADLPPAMAAVLRRALTLEPSRRGTAADFALDLRHSGQPVAVELAAGRVRPAQTPDGPVGGPAAKPPLPAVDDALLSPEDVPTTPGPPTVTHQRRAPGSALAVPPTGGPAETTDRRRPPAALPPARGTAGASGPGGGGRHAATPVKRARRRRDEREQTAERARALVAARSVPPAEPSAARPHFTRPTATVNEVVVGRPAPTSAVAKARPTLPSARRWWPPRVLGMGAAVLVVLIAATLGIVLSRGTSDHVTHRAASARPAPVLVPVPTLPPQSPVGHATHVPPPDWAGTLRSLDATRSRAFATRDATLLSRVYVAGPLRSADAAALVRLVPRGCGLRGVRTDYRAVTTRGSGGTVVLTALASLPPSQLVCRGHVVRTAAAVAPTRLRITLVRRSGAVLIATERTLT